MKDTKSYLDRASANKNGGLSDFVDLDHLCFTVSNVIHTDFNLCKNDFSNKQMDCSVFIMVSGHAAVKKVSKFKQFTNQRI